MVVKGLKNPRGAMRYVQRNSTRYWMKRWSRKVSVPCEDHLAEIDEALLRETEEYAEQLEDRLKDKYEGEVQTSDFHPQSGVGGGASYDLLYFYTRHLEPDTVVETGVSAGWSSRAILDALDKNQKGVLYSNDLPYSERAEIQEKHDTYPDREEVGILVNEALESRWELYLGPDRDNLPNILSNIDSIDIFHYDSDKSYEGREFAMNSIQDKLHESSIVVMDDITDNTFFRDYVHEKGIDYSVVSSRRGGRDVGVIEGSW